MNWQNVIYLDLFSGVGGFTYGFLQAGMRFKKHYFSEIDKHSIAVYKHHFHEAEAVGDITSFSGDGIERPNIITFGFPCQDLSIAGKQAGLAGARSGLFFQALRLIERFKPEVFIFENVAGLLSSNEGQDFEIVLRAIADIGLYECEWQLVNTRWLLPQNRERVYFVGHLAGSSRPRVFPFREGDKEFNGNGRKGDGVVCGTVDSNYWKVADGKRTMIRWQNKNDGVVEGDTAPTLRSSGGTDIREMPNVMDKVPNVIISHYGHKDKPPVESQDVPTLKAQSHGHEPMVVQINPSIESGGRQPYQQNRVYDAEGISPALHSLSEKMNVSVRPILTPDRKEKRQNGRRMKDDGEPAFTLNTQDKHGIMMGGNIRRLTEIECERLQGFLDNWTQYGNYDGVIKKVPKTQRYKQMGNAVTTLWPTLIAKRLMTNGTE